MFKFSGRRPNDLGIHDGKLKGPSKKPNSVCSHVSSGPAAIAPLDAGADPEATWNKLKDIVGQQGEIIEADDRYLYAEYTTPLMGYVDDVEFLRDDTAGAIHVRSASRLGYSDLGANRKRIEKIRHLLA